MGVETRGPHGADLISAVSLSLHENMKVLQVWLLSCLSSCLLATPVLWPPTASISSQPAISPPLLPSLVLQSNPQPLPHQPQTVHLPPLSPVVPYRPSITFLDPPGTRSCVKCRYQCSQCQHCSLTQEAGYEVQCSPLTRKVCSAVPSYVARQDEEDVCETEYETVCTTIIATKYVKDCVLSQYGVRECSQFPVQKPVEKCASVPKQSCVRSRLKQKCKNVTQNVCRKVAVYKPAEKCETVAGPHCHSPGSTCLRTGKICEK